MPRFHWTRTFVIHRRMAFCNCSLIYPSILVFGGMKTARPFVVRARPFTSDRLGVAPNPNEKIRVDEPIDRHNSKISETFET